jgi:hypothetical protein
MNVEKFIFCEPLGMTGKHQVHLRSVVSIKLAAPLCRFHNARCRAKEHFRAGEFIGKMRKIFISGYDGTITGKDFYSLLAERYIPADTPDYFAWYREGRITHFEAMAAYFAFAPTKEWELEDLLEASRADPVAHLLGRNVIVFL